MYNNCNVSAYTIVYLNVYKKVVYFSTTIQNNIYIINYFDYFEYYPYL